MATRELLHVALVRLVLLEESHELRLHQLPLQKPTE